MQFLIPISMEQRLYITSIREGIDMGSRDYGCESKSFPLSALTKDAKLVVSESWGQPNPADADDTVHIVWELTDMELTDDNFSFTMMGDRYHINRHWQVLGTESYDIPNAYISNSKRLIFYFGTEEKAQESQYDRLKELYDQITANKQVGDFWKNIPLAKEALHLMKDVAPQEDEETLKEFCELVVNDTLLLDADTPRLILSFMDLWHVLNESTYNWEEETYRLLRMTDPKTSEEEKMELLTQKRFLRYDPVQLSEAWEDNIYEVEKELDELFKDEPRHMGFCFRYWSAKRTALAKRGIDWRSPAAMNPRTRFD